jgi:Xaa-Pro aminopeptidase
MAKINYFNLVFLLAIFQVQLVVGQTHYQTDFPPEEFKDRRDQVFAEIGNNIALIQGAPSVKGFNVFRQSNTFYYLCGLEVPHAYLLLDGASKKSTLYLPHRDEGRERGEGKQMSAEDADLVKEMTGVDRVLGYEMIGRNFVWSYLVRMPVPDLYTPFSPAEGHMQSRDEVLGGLAGQYADPWDNLPSREGHFISLIRERYPQFQVKDLSPILDRMRIIKSKREVDLIRTASELAGLGIVEAIKSTKPGVMEYQLDAAANYVFSINGARSEGYRSITAGGTNAWMGHYYRNSDPVKDGDLILMDIAPDYRYYTSDVARMWPVNGKYTKDQRDLYGFIVAYRNVLLKHIKPGVTPAQVMEASATEMKKVFSEITFSKDIYREAAEGAFTFGGHLSHPVGMAVHDVGVYRDRPLQPGMVFSIDPMIWVPDEKLYIRMEDVVVVTDDGVENLSDNIPAELDALEKLMKQEGIVQKVPASIN